MISIDGTTGEVFLGEVPVVDSLVVRLLRGRRDGRRTTSSSPRSPGSWSTPTRARRLRVRANADTPSDAARARRFGAQGIGLCRTEHMFLGERRELVEHLILAETTSEQEKALADAAAAAARRTSTAILEAMDGLPVTIRLIDPPLHEFLPDFTELSVEVALPRTRGEPQASATRSCSTRCSGCTRRTRCSGCAASGSAS